MNAEYRHALEANIRAERNRGLVCKFAIIALSLSGVIACLYSLGVICVGTF